MTKKSLSTQHLLYLIAMTLKVLTTLPTKYRLKSQLQPRITLVFYIISRLFEVGTFVLLVSRLIVS